jgi:hypothetical protein
MILLTTKFLGVDISVTMKILMCVVTVCEHLCTEPMGVEMNMPWEDHKGKCCSGF